MRSRVRLALVLLSVGLAPMAAALQVDTSSIAYDKAGDIGHEASFVDAAPPLANASIFAPHVTRRLVQINVSPGANLQTVVDNANAGDEIVLADGTYTGSGTSQFGSNMLYINKDITIRALNPGQAVLDGQNARRVMYVSSGTVVLDGLNINRGQTSYVRASR